ncbi:MAG: manganese efflux pump MntP family protein [Oscillospiraceae bacterium]|jgi:putative Mn2+ efflux pump MntP|nr:manganese efflux pump MntP family protein [Oscillospiraceae bacterium]
MDYFSLCGIAAGLAMDALAVSITNGAVTRRVTPRFALKIAFFFGLFQSVMPTAGWLIGKAGEGLIKAVDHWIALILLGYLGISMILESRKKRKARTGCSWRDDIPLKTLLALAVATSIDALATGVILPSAVGASTPALMLISVLLIGLITFVICFAGVYIGRRFGTVCASRAEIAGGDVLIAIGLKIFIEHMFFNG